MILLVFLLWAVSGCNDYRPAIDDPAPENYPSLKPAPTRTALLPLALPTVTAVGFYPPTGTPTPAPGASEEPAPPAQVPTSTPTPSATTLATPMVVEGPQLIAKPGLLAIGTDCQAEIEAYGDLMASDVDLSALQAPLIGNCLADAGQADAAMTVYRNALNSELDRITEVAVRQGLGDLLLEAGDYTAAVAQYDAILAVAEAEISRSQALYQAAQAELMAGNSQAGYVRLQSLINDYPEASQSYQALNELLAAGHAIDDLLQGQIAYNAQAYDVSAAAFARAGARLYLAWSLEKLGDVDGALAQLDSLIASRETPEDGTAPDLTGAAQARIERAKVNDRAGRSLAALEDYQSYLNLYPQGADAPEAAWRWAALAEAIDNRALAVERYLAFGQAYPDHDDAPQALFRTGYLSWQLGDVEDAQAIWRQAFETYSSREYGAAALLWLLKTLPESQKGPYIEAALNGNGNGYYAPRAAHLANGVEPFVSAGWSNLNPGDTGREFAESWLREWLGLAPGTPVAELSVQLAGDPRLAWAERLWSSGSRGEAARQFELLRTYYAGDARASYQLALYFRDLGLYKSSIMAAQSLMSLAGLGAAGAPRFIARLAYPAYYGEQIAAEAQRYGFDPLLQLALIREESYFDPLATSPLDARGLSQILPGTGAYVAGRLGWPGYDGGALYRPETAITFGSYLLDEQLVRYGGDVAAALAAYNAGPAYADGWVQLGADDFDSLIESIDFPETQRYVKQIYITHAIYRFLYS